MRRGRRRHEGQCRGDEQARGESEEMTVTCHSCHVLAVLRKSGKITPRSLFLVYNIVLGWTIS
jgi:ribosomal protein L19E